MSNLHNALKYSTILQSGVELAAGMSQDAEGVVRLGETLTPSLDIWSQPEWAFLRGERLGVIVGFAAAVAAEFGYVGIANPASSNAIVVVESVSYSLASTARVNLEVAPHTTLSGTLTSTLGIASLRDRRWQSTVGRTFFVTGTDPSAALGTNVDYSVQQAAPAVVPNELPHALPFILKPGDDLVVVAQTVNLDLTAVFKWRERQAFSGELPTP